MHGKRVASTARSPIRFAGPADQVNELSAVTMKRWTLKAIYTASMGSSQAWLFHRYR